MEYRRLGNSDLTVSSIGMGCVTFGREIDRAAAFTVLDRARDGGITLFDTAAAYADGASEVVLGQWVADHGIREDVLLATKVKGILSQQNIVRSAEESLTRLQTDHIDLFQLHHWDEETPLDDVLAGLSALVDSGKVRCIGCSNWPAAGLARSLTRSQEMGLHRIQSVQPPHNLVQREIESDLLPLCTKQGIGVITYSPLAAGFLAGKYQRGDEVPRGTRFDIIPGHQPIYFTDHGYRVLEQLRQVAAETDQSMVQIALGWALTQPGISSVLIGARDTSQVDQAFQAKHLGIDDELCRVLTESDVRN